MNNLTMLEQQIFDISLIVFNVLFAIAFLSLIIFYIYTSRQLKKTSNILTTEKIISKKQHIKYTMQSIAIILVIWVLFNYIFINAFNIVDWSRGFVATDVAFWIINSTSAVVIILILANIILLSAKQAKTKEIKKLVENKDQLKRNFIAFVIMLSINLILNLVTIIISFFNTGEENTWLEIARTFTNYFILAFSLLSLVWLMINVFKYSNAKDEQAKILTKKNLKNSFLMTSLILSGFLIGNFIIDFTRLIQNYEESGYSTIAYTMLNYIIFLGIYISIVALIYEFYRFGKQNNDLDKTKLNKQRIKNTFYAIAILSTLLVIGNIIISITTTWFSWNTGETETTQFLYSIANQVVAICCFLVLAGIGWNAINLSIGSSSSSNKIMLDEHKKRIIVGMWCLLCCALLFVFANILVAVALLII